MVKKVKPNVVAGGSAIDLGNGLFYMRGRTHKQGGIDIGKNPETGIEVENGEIYDVYKGRVFSAQPILNGISPANALLMGGNPNSIFNAQELWKKVNRVTDDGRKFAPGGKRKTKIGGRKTVWDNDKTDKGDMYYDIVKARYISAMDSLKRNGFTYDDAVRLAPMIVQQNILEGGWILNRNDNNYGGMKSNNGETTMNFNTVEDFYDAYIKMLDNRWGASRGKENNWRNAKNLDDWARILNREDLGLTTKEKYNEYNSKHKDNPVYLYAPEWHNNNRSYREHLRKAEDRVNAYFNWIQEDYKYPKWGNEEKNFRDWYDTYARAHNLDLNPDAKEHYYDYRAYYKNRTKEQANEEWKLDSHLPDTYKMPGHPTFSTESIYSTKKTPGGTWKKVGLGPVYDEQFVDSNYTKRLKTYKNVSFALGGDNLKQNGYIEPSVVTAKLPAKFKGSQAAARRYAEGYQFGKRIANERDKTVPYILAAANAPMLIEGLAVAPLATLGSIGGGYVGGKIGNKVGGPLGGVVGGLIGGGLGAGAGTGLKYGIKAGTKYGNGVLDRLAESIVRVGDNADKFDLIGQLTNKNTIKYILNPKAKNLAYKLPYKYSGTDTSMTNAFPGDVVDQFFGKTPVPDATYDYSILPKGMQKYIAKNYPNKKIPIRDLSDIVDLGGGEVGGDVDMRTVLKQLNNKDEINIGGSSNALFKKGSMETVLDPGGFNAYITKGDNIKYNTNGTIKSGTANIKGVDIWKFKPSDYIKRYNYSPINLLSRLGLKFIDSRGTPIVHIFKGEMPFYIGEYKYGGIHIKPSKRGTFTAAAKRHNMSVQEFARTVLNNKANYSAAMIKKANFARNASKWHKKEFGGDMTKQYFITPNNIYKLGGDIRKKALLGTDGNNYERFIDGDGLMKYRIGNTVYSKDGFSRVTGMSLDEIDSYFDAIDNEGRGEITPSIVTATRRPLTSESSITPSIVTANRPSNNKSFVSETNIEPSVVTAYNRANPGVRQNTIGFTDSLAGTSYYGPQRTNELPAPQTPTQPTQSTQPATPQRSKYSTIRINTSGRPTRGLGVTSLRPYDGRPIETQVQTPASGSQSSSTGGQRRTPTVASTSTSNNTPIVNQTPTQATTPTTTRVSPYPTLEPLIPITSPGAVTPQTIVDNNRRGLVRLRGNGINIRNGADWLGLGINLAGNLAASLINRSAIKGMRYVDAPIPLSAQKLKTEINVNPQLDQIRENVAGQERLIADNTADSRVALARRQRVRNLGSEQFQSLMGQRENMETQLINRDRLNRQNIDAQNVGQYNQWRRGAYDFENRSREMLAENAVAGINNAAEDIAGERGILARREGRNRDILNAALIAATSPNAQNVIGSKEFAKFLEQLGYTGDFSLLRKRLNI